MNRLAHFRVTGYWFQPLQERITRRRALHLLLVHPRMQSRVTLKTGQRLLTQQSHEIKNVNFLAEPMAECIRVYHFLFFIFCLFHLHDCLSYAHFLFILLCFQEKELAYQRRLGAYRQGQGSHLSIVFLIDIVSVFFLRSFLVVCCLTRSHRLLQTCDSCFFALLEGLHGRQGGRNTR